jgi:hypothetical protein
MISFYASSCPAGIKEGFCPNQNNEKLNTKNIHSNNGYHDVGGLR